MVHQPKNRFYIVFSVFGLSRTRHDNPPNPVYYHQYSLRTNAGPACYSDSFQETLACPPVENTVR